MSYGSDITGITPGQQGGDEKKPATNTTAPIGDGGPAFPRPISRYDHDGVPCDMYDAQEGMTLRDYFAAKAMAALIVVNERHDDESLKKFRMGCVRGAYAYADMMLAARKAVRP